MVERMTCAYLAREPGALALLAPSATADARRAHLSASTAHDAWEALPRISSPTLVVHGEDDRLCVVENARRLARALPRAELCVVPSARHAYYVDVPAANERVVAFLLAHPLTGSDLA